MRAHVYLHISKLSSIDTLSLNVLKLAITSRFILVPHKVFNFFSSYSSLRPSFRDADGDVDTSPMWTFPTVRPTSMNKLQKGYTHTDSDVRHATQLQRSLFPNTFPNTVFPLPSQEIL